MYILKSRSRCRCICIMHRESERSLNPCTPVIAVPQERRHTYLELRRNQTIKICLTLLPLLKTSSLEVYLRVCSLPQLFLNARRAMSCSSGTKWTKALEPHTLHSPYPNSAFFVEVRFIECPLADQLPR